MTALTPTPASKPPRQPVRLPNDLAQAAQTLTQLESSHPALAEEVLSWVNAPLTTDKKNASFDADAFEREFAKAQAPKSCITLAQGLNPSAPPSAKFITNKPLEL